MSTLGNQVTLKECPQCKGAVMQHFDTCPHCGACQSKRCTEEDGRLREALTKSQGYARIKTDESESHNSRPDNLTNG